MLATIDIMDDELAGDERRGDSERMRIGRQSTVRAPGAAPRDVTVDDLSSRGFRFTTPANIPVGTVIQVGLSGAGMAQAEVVRSEGAEHGCIFARPLTPTQLANAFTSANVVDGNFQTLFAHPETEVSVDKYPGAVRALVIVGGSIVGWTAIIAGAVALVR